MFDIAEVQLVLDAKNYGDIEPLLTHFVEHGLSNRESRETVAKLARGEALRGRGRIKDKDLAGRNAFISILVANRRGLLRREKKDVRKAISIIANQLQLSCDTLDRKQVKRIWEDRSSHYEWQCRIAYQLGRQWGVEYSWND